MWTAFVLDKSKKKDCCLITIWFCFALSRQLAKFREMHSYRDNEVRPDEEFDGLIGRNIRPLQPNGTRKVYSSEDKHGHNLHMTGTSDGYEDPFRTSTVTRHSAFPDGGPGSVIVRQCGRA